MDEEGLRNELLEIIRDGALTEIFRAEEAWRLAEYIGKRANSINEAGFGDLFGDLQLMLADQITLAIGKLFEHPRRYPTRSVPAAINFLDRHADSLPIYEPGLLVESLRHLEAPSNLLDPSRTYFTRELVEWLRGQLPTDAKVHECAHSTAWHRAKIRRDKRIAHNETYQISDDERATWTELITLVRRGLDIISPISFGYVGYVIAHPPGEFIMKLEAGRNAATLKRLLTAAGVGSA